MATKNKKEVETLSLGEKLKNADLKITVKKGQQDFIFLWQEQSELIHRLEFTLKENFGIVGKPQILALACKYLLNDIESEIGVTEPEKKDAK